MRVIGLLLLVLCVVSFHRHSATFTESSETSLQTDNSTSLQTDNSTSKNNNIVTNTD